MYEKMIAVTNRHLCGEAVLGAEDDFRPGTVWYRAYLDQIGVIAASKPRAIVLREKDLSCEQYIRLAEEVLAVCRSCGTELILHNFTEAAEALNYKKIHLPLAKLREMEGKTDGTAFYEKIGTSVHSLEDVSEAEKLGAGYVFAGNIYETDCKKGLPGRGISFLEKVCRGCEIPVYAIGGISLPRMPEVLKAGAAGGCMMSGFMKLKKS